jgi:hypothetical protein
MPFTVDNPVVMLVLALLAGVGGGSIIPLVLGKWLGKKKEDAGLTKDYQEIAERATEALEKEQKMRITQETRLDEFQKQMDELQRRVYGPFLIHQTLEVVTKPGLSIRTQEMKIELSPEKGSSD